jgi:glycosyltransferase involved in cell wall biosynthesis
MFGYDFRLFAACNRQSSGTVSVDPYGGRAMLLPEGSIPIIHQLLFVFGAFVYGLVNRNQYQLIHAQPVTPEVTFPAMLLGKVLSKPVVLYGRGADIYAYGANTLHRRLIVKWAMIQCDALVALTEDMKRKMQNISSRNDIVMIPNGVDLSVSKNGRRGELRKRLHLRHNLDIKLVVYCGRLVPFKGTTTLVRAIPLVIQEFRNVRFVIVGKGPEYKVLVEMVKDLGIERWVRILGGVQHDEYLKWLRFFNIFVYPELRGQGLSNAVLEAMARGIPTVASNVGGLANMICHGSTGLLFRVGNPRELAKMLLILLKDQNLANIIGQNSRHLVKSLYSMDSVARRIVSLYESFFQKSCEHLVSI